MWKYGMFWNAYFSENEEDISQRDILLINRQSGEYALEEGVDELYAQCVDVNGNFYKAQYLDRFIFDALLEKARAQFSALSDGKKYEAIEEWVRNADYVYEGEPVPKEIVWKGLRCELSAGELRSIIQKRYEIDDYYDFDLITAGIRRYENGAITPDYYGDWCVLWLCLNSNPYKANGRLNNLYYRIADMFDGEGFLDKTKRPSERLGEIRELVGELKWLDHQIRNEKKHKNRAFCNKGVKVFVQFDYYNGGADSETYKFLIVGERTKKFNLLYVDDPLFDDSVNYIFCAEDIGEIMEHYFDYVRDRKFGLEYIPKNIKEYMKKAG